MAGLLISREIDILRRTAREWSASSCEPFPCGLAVWRYVCEISGLEEIELPEHQSRKAMLELLREKGGLEQYARDLMLSVWWEEVEDPLPGDVAVAEMPGMGLTCTICAGRMLMAKGDGFVLLRPAPIRAIWRFTQCRRLSPPFSSQLSA